MEKMDFNIVRQHASDAYRYARQSDDRMVNSMINYYQESKKSPSIANLIMHDSIKRSIDKYGKETVEDVQMGNIGAFKDFIKKSIIGVKNIKMCDSSEKVAPFLHEHAKSYLNLYPKTADLREKLISEERIIFDSVTPKAGWFTKLKLARFLKK